MVQGKAKNEVSIIGPPVNTTPMQSLGEVRCEFTSGGL